ncbi:hypothetical protein [Microbacterium sp. ProA8]|jgi:hypothetical protein
MTTTTTRVYPVGALHLDDDTECTSPDVCGRTVYWVGGAPLHEFPTLGE